MDNRQLNAWNWSATTDVYCNGFKDHLTSFDTEQYWDGTRLGHMRLMKALVERLEDMSDRLGLQYRVWQPTAIKGRRWAAELAEVVEVDRLPS